jgi:hypothetical protein
MTTPAKKAVLRRQNRKLTRQQLARSHRPMNQQVVEKMLARHGRQ